MDMSGGSDASMGGAGEVDIAHNQAVVAYIEITNSSSTTRIALAPKGCTPLYPTYAPDLRDQSLAASNSQGMIFNGNTTFTMTPGSGTGCYVNGDPFVYPETSPIELPIGKVVHWNFQFLNLHPMHLHINPYQIVSLPANPSKPYTSWFEVGDRHDTLIIPNIGSMDTIGLRVQPGPYPGFDVLHCHLLHHEDSGCMKVTSMYCPGTVPTITQPEKCSGVTYPVKGTLTVGGTGYGDPAYGDPPLNDGGDQNSTDDIETSSNGSVPDPSLAASAPSEALLASAVNGASVPYSFNTLLVLFSYFMNVFLSL